MIFRRKKQPSAPDTSKSPCSDSESSAKESSDQQQQPDREGQIVQAIGDFQRTIMQIDPQCEHELGAAAMLATMTVQHAYLIAHMDCFTVATARWQRAHGLFINMGKYEQIIAEQEAKDQQPLQSPAISPTDPRYN